MGLDPWFLHLIIRLETVDPKRWEVPQKSLPGQWKGWGQRDNPGSWPKADRGCALTLGKCSQVWHHPTTSHLWTGCLRLVLERSLWRCWGAAESSHCELGFQHVNSGKIEFSSRYTGTKWLSFLFFLHKSYKINIIMENAGFVLSIFSFVFIFSSHWFSFFYEQFHLKNTLLFLVCMCLSV